MPWFRDTYRDAVWKTEALRPNEKLVALVYADFAGDPKDPTNDVAWVSWPELSARTSIRSKSSLNRALEALRAAGWLVKIEARKQHRSPRYRLVIPANPEVRETHVSEVIEANHSDEPEAAPELAPEVAEENVSDPSEVHETNQKPVDNHPSEVAEMDHRRTPEVLETTPEVAETTPRGSAGEPDISNYPSNRYNLASVDGNHRTPASSTHKHRRFTVDGDCVECGHFEPCPDCRRLARINPDMSCHRHPRWAS